MTHRNHSRGLFLAFTIAMAAAQACGSDDDSGPKDERGDLGKKCSSSSDCGDGLTCVTSSPLSGQCSVSCNDSDECQLKYGLGSFCIGANYCVRECVQASDCLEGTTCDDDVSWCRR